MEMLLTAAGFIDILIACAGAFLQIKFAHTALGNELIQIAVDRGLANGKLAAS